MFQVFLKEIVMGMFLRWAEIFIKYLDLKSDIFCFN